MFAFWQAADLPIGTLGGMGPGMLPKALAVLFGLLGAFLAFDSFLKTGLPLDRPPRRVSQRYCLFDCSRLPPLRQVRTRTCRFQLCCLLEFAITVPTAQHVITTF